MTQTILVVYDGQVFRPETPLLLEANTRYLVTITSVPPTDSRREAWDVLDDLAGTVDAPPDWAAEHDYYLYGNPKRPPETSA